MRLLCSCIAIACAGVSVGSCRVSHVVTVRTCVVKGAVNPENRSDSIGVATSAVALASKTWVPHGIGFVAPFDPALIDDPLIPVNEKSGDMVGSEGYGNDDTAALEKACHDAWAVRGYGEGVQAGLMVVFVRNILNTGQHGFSTRLTVYDSQGKNCLKPYSFTDHDVAGHWSFVETVDDNKARSIELIGNTVAHELGHQLLVRHGDGKDNDLDGLWDLGCDDEAALELAALPAGQSTPLMWPTGEDPNATYISPLQAEVASAAVKLLEQAGLAN